MQSIRRIVSLLFFQLGLFASLPSQGASLFVTAVLEGGSFSVRDTQTVRFGTASAWVQKSVTDTTVLCNSAFFGKDPAPASAKQCQMLIVASPLPPPPPGAECGRMTGAACEVFKGINAQRTANGLSALKPLSNCERLAQSHSEDMAKNGFFSHTSPTQGSFSDRADDFELMGSAGENIAYGYTTTSVVTGWMESPGHRSNILGSGYRSTGVGYATNSSGRPYYTQCFSSMIGDQQEGIEY